MQTQAVIFQIYNLWYFLKPMVVILQVHKKTIKCILGTMSGLVTQTKVVGFVTASEIVQVKRYRNGFMNGVKHIFIYTAGDYWIRCLSGLSRTQHIYHRRIQ